MWGQAGEGAAIAEQGALLEALRGGGGRSLRERFGTASGCRFNLPASTVRAIDLRYLARWAAGRRKPALRQVGIDELYLGKKQKFVTVESNLESQEPLWFGEERKKETLDEFFRTQLSRKQRGRIEAACLDMWEPYRLSLELGSRLPAGVRQVSRPATRQSRHR